MRARLLRVRAHEGMVVRGAGTDTGDVRGDIYLHRLTEIATEAVDELLLLWLGRSLVQLIPLPVGTGAPDALPERQGPTFAIQDERLIGDGGA